MIANDTGAENGTGAQLQLLDAQGDVVATYTLIIFGDVNGDASVDATDSSLIMQIVARTTTLSDIQTFAGDVNGDTLCDATDASLIMQGVARTGSVPVNPFA